MFIALTTHFTKVLSTLSNTPLVLPSIATIYQLHLQLHLALLLRAQYCHHDPLHDLHHPRSTSTRESKSNPHPTTVCP